MKKRFKKELGQLNDIYRFIELKTENIDSNCIDDIKLLSSSPISIEILPVSYHIKNDKFVNSHLHFNMTYLLQANDTSELKIKPDENSGLKWVDLDDAYKYTNEECMIPIYKKLRECILRQLP